MTTFLHKLLRAGVTMAAGLGRILKRSGRLFLTKDQVARRASEEMEAERLDRLRNPSNYQGR
jgi:hypothetical protein